MNIMSNKGENMNNTIIKFMREFSSGALIGSYHYQETFYDTLVKKLSPLDVMIIDKQRKNATPRQKKERKAIIDDYINRKIPFIIHEPNGSQASPDISIIWGNTRIDFETKTQKKGQVVWNSGLPTGNIIYTIVCTNNNEVTYALGNNMLWEHHHKLLRDMGTRHHEIANKDSFLLEQESCPISYYPRAMHNDLRCWLDDNLDGTPVPNRRDREHNVLVYISKITWPI